MKVKYELTSEKKEFLGRTLFRIRALMSFGSVKKGDVGGFVEKKKNLSHKGDAWVYDDAWVCGNARVYDDAQVYGKTNVKTVLCSRFNFGSDWQVELWNEKEKEFDAEVKKRLK